MNREEALNNLKKILGFSPNYDEAFYTLFPELRESEDERIRKEIRDFLIDMECKKEWIAHMEKQKEQKPAEWSEEDENRLNAVVELLENSSAIHPNYSRRKLIIWLKSLRPSWKPSEEQMAALYIMICESRPADQQLLQDIYYGLKKL